ncbi:hypothetical protein SDC9_18774 [bioreactor metagenome]|uniref:Uncharacterized protein n=1 Tax=bioreactor metagenome TaxID=1076179 RepID=A0A644U3U5_9ZZZZ
MFSKTLLYIMDAESEGFSGTSELDSLAMLSLTKLISMDI